MQFTIAFTTLLAVASAAAVSQRSPVSVKGRDAGKLVARDGVCGGISNPLCCQLDVSGVANLNCENGTSPPLCILAFYDTAVLGRTNADTSYSRPR